MRHTQRLAVPLGALLASWALTACQTKPATAATPAATPAAARTASTAATTTDAARPGAPAATAAAAPARTRPNPAEVAREAKAREDSLDRVRVAAMRADSITDAANAAKTLGARRAAMKATLTTAISFDAESSAVRFDASAPLDQKVPILIANPALTLRITGHAYERTSDKDNTALGLARAESAKQYIVIQGVAANRIQTAGHADQKPAGAVDDSLANLRRDDFEVTSSPPELENP